MTRGLPCCSGPGVVSVPRDLILGRRRGPVKATQGATWTGGLSATLTGVTGRSVGRRGWYRGLSVITLSIVLAGCTSPNPHHATGHATTTSTTSAPSTSTTVPASGARTVLSPIGLNIRSAPSTTAAVLVTAAQGAVLTAVAQSSGWLEVKGPTVTGWISADPTLSAPGTFAAYTSTQHQVSLLYPQGWTATESPPASVVFHPSSGRDTVVVTTAATVGQLGRGLPGYHQTNDEQVVVCGVTGELVTFVQMAAPTTSTQPAGIVAEHYLAQVHLTLDAQHALGIDANVADMSQLQSYRDFVNSVTFPFPQCHSTGA
jgi:hypothetical protein